MANFAIKDSIDFKLTLAGESEVYIDVDYVNTGSLTVEGDATYAKKKGSNAISFPNAKTGTITVEAEVANWKWLALQFGGDVSGSTNDTLTVKGVSAAKSFKLEGTFDVTFDDGSGTKTMTIVANNVSPQTNAEMTFSTEEVTGFKITFDMMVDSAGNLFVMKPYTAPGSLSVKSSK